MAISPMPAPLQQLGGRRFAFRPAIRNIEHNLWLYRRATWTEVIAVNARSGAEACIPRSLLGEVSFFDDGAVSVALRREAEWAEGRIRIYRQPVIELPVAVNQSPAPAPQPGHRARVVSIRLEPHHESRRGLKLMVGMVLGAVACLIVGDIARVWLPAGAADDYGSIVHRLGAPSSDYSVQTADGHTFRLLRYPVRRSTLVLAVNPGHSGSSRYIGAIDFEGHVVNSVRLADGSNTASLLRSLPPF